MLVTCAKYWTYSNNVAMKFHKNFFLVLEVKHTLESSPFFLAVNDVFPVFLMCLHSKDAFNRKAEKCVSYLTICLWCCKVLKWWWAGEKFTAWLTYECLVIGLPWDTWWWRRSGPLGPPLTRTLPLAKEAEGWVGEDRFVMVACAEVAKRGCCNPRLTLFSSSGLMRPGEFPFSY